MSCNLQRMPRPDATEFEVKISDTAEPIFNSGKGGYHWKPVDELLVKELNVLRPRCKKGTDSGRAANVFSESHTKDFDFYMVFLGPDYSVDSFLKVARDRMKRHALVKTAAAVENHEGQWRVTHIIERSDVDLGKDLIDHFPLVDEVEKVEVQGDITEAPEVNSVDLDDFLTAINGLEPHLDEIQMLPSKFESFCESNGFSIDRSVSSDVLACVLSSQMVLFAGPSGTGKSRIARLLQEFFSPSSVESVIEAKRHWISTEDVLGYYSVLGDTYASTSDTVKLLGIHEHVANWLESEAKDPYCPIILVEEANLSPIEGYFGPAVHGLSGTSNPFIEWHIHSMAGGVEDAGNGLKLPPVLRIGPFPRIFGTINVDATAAAPSRKVVARSAVVLMGSQGSDLDDMKPVLDTFDQGGGVGEPTLSSEPWLIDPAAAIRDLDDDQSKALASQLAETVKSVGAISPSRRQLAKSLMYMAYFIKLADEDPDGVVIQIAAENAILHFVLPVLESDAFGRAIETLSGLGLCASSEDSSKVGGLLQPRVELLRNEMSIDAALLGSADFWLALS